MSSGQKCLRLAARARGDAERSDTCPTRAQQGEEGGFTINHTVLCDLFLKEDSARIGEIFKNYFLLYYVKMPLVTFLKVMRRSS